MLFSCRKIFVPFLLLLIFLDISLSQLENANDLADPAGFLSQDSYCLDLHGDPSQNYHANEACHICHLGHCASINLEQRPNFALGPRPNQKTQTLYRSVFELSREFSSLFRPPISV